MSELPAVRDSSPATYVDPIPESKVDLVKRVFAKGASDDELALFLEVCRRTGLSPFARQIYCIKRYDRGEDRQVMSIQTSIDGHRLIADRTGRYVPGRETVVKYDDNGKPISATAFVKKLVAGEWHEISATAYYDEAVQTTKAREPNHFWATMPRLMLSKVAEAMALRRAFPAELSGLYTTDEMGGVDPLTGEIREPRAIKPSTPYVDEVMKPTAPPAPAAENVFADAETAGAFIGGRPAPKTEAGQQNVAHAEALWEEAEARGLDPRRIRGDCSPSDFRDWRDELRTMVEASREAELATAQEATSEEATDG